MMLFALILGGYFLGSIPVAWILTKLVTGQDLRELGSGNVGVMNAALSVHRWVGALVFVLEALKGILAVVLPRGLGANEFEVGCTVIAAFVGTRWSVWLGWRGGRGNTLGGAALAVLSPLTLLIEVVVYFLAQLVSKSNFVAMRVALVALPIVFGLVTGSWVAVLFGATFALLFLSTHRVETDDHLLLKDRFSTLWGFLTSPKRE